MQNDSDVVQDSRIPRNNSGSGLEIQPSSDDIFQAAALLVGVYGPQAVDHAVQQKDHLDGRGDQPGVMVWELILSRIEVLLHYAPPRNLN